MANKSKLRVQQVHYDTAKELSRIHQPPKDWPTPPRNVKQRCTLWLNRLAVDADIKPEGLSREQIYLEAIRALVRTHGSDASYPARMLQSYVREWNEQRRKLWKAERPAKEKRLTTSVADDCDAYEPLGIHAGDKLEGEETTVDDLCAGDLVAVRDKENDQWAGIGYFVATDKKQFHIQEQDGCTYHYDQGAEWWTIYLLPAIMHRTEIKRGQTTEAERVQRELRVEALRQKLDKLTNIEDETARFRIEREIYDLTHALACGEDEWPEVIAA